MQVSEIDNQTSLRSAHTCKIGKLFKERRQLLSLSETEVASKIFVNVNYIKGIEHGDSVSYTHLTLPTILRV